MSTKSTFILSDDNEHIYYDCSDDSIHMEFDCKNIDYFFSNDGDELTIEIKKGTDLYDKLEKIFWKSGWCGSEPAI